MLRGLIRRRPSPAMLVAMVALFVALGGSSYAALRVGSGQIADNAVRSRDIRNNDVRGSDIRTGTIASGDVRDGALLAKDFKSGELPAGRAGSPGAAGPQGPMGPQGPQGPLGPSAGYAAQRTIAVALPESGAQVTLVERDVPAGSYIVTARLQGATLTDPDGPPGNSYRYDCVLMGGDQLIDDYVARVGMTVGLESYLTFNGGFAGSGPIRLACRAGNGHPLNVNSAALSAIRVAELR